MTRITTAITAAVLAAAIAGCSGDQETPEPSATANGPTATASAAALDDRPVDEQLLEAVTTGDVEVAVLALDAGADPDAATGDANGNTPFTLAVTRDDPELVRALAEAGATLEDPETGYSALALAAAFAGPEVIAMLLEAGTDPDGTGAAAGMPLTNAAYEGKLDVMTVLLEAGADPNIVVVDPSGFEYTPLFSSAFGGSREAADLLLQWGADPAWESVDGSTAGGWASGQGYRELGEYLDSLISAGE